MAGVYFSQTSVICFCRRFSYCPCYRGVSYSGVSARRELTLQVQPLTNRSRRLLNNVSFQTSAFESRHSWKLASSTLFCNEFVYRIVPVVLLILCVHCFAVKPLHHHCHIMQQKSFHISHELCTGAFSRHNYWPTYL